MNYQQAINWLYNATPMFQQTGSSAYKEGLENTLALDKRFDYPHRNYKTLHVGGTNGKGSTSHLLASILQQAGYNTGLYTSPHLIDFRERIRINGQCIPEDFVTHFVEKNRNFFESIQPSFFEVTTSLAFLYFASQQIDVAVIEVGLGGRLDCTNIITPDLSIITNISFDHTSLLGNTLEQIASEKVGIIKPGIPVIIGEKNPETDPVFVQKAQECQSPLYFAEEEQPVLKSARCTVRGIREGWKLTTKNYGTIEDELGGLVQIKNATTVLCAIDRLREQGYVIPIKAVQEGFATVIETTGLQGRWQIIQTHPKIILDTGHNAGGMEYIVQQLLSEKYNRLHFIIGMVNDKDVSSVLKLLPKKATYYFTQASVARALNAGELARKAWEAGLEGSPFASVKEALDRAKNNASPDDLIFVGGSTFVVADALQQFSAKTIYLDLLFK